VAAIVWLAALVIGPILADSGGTAAPVYSADSIVNSAAGVPAFFAPNTFISIYGQNLSTVTRAISPDDITAGTLPTVLGGTGVRVLINSIPADLWYVSPTLVNVLVPTLLIAGPATLQLESNGLAGPPVQITLGNTAPALFQIDATTVLAVHLDGTLVSTASPAHAGEIIVLFATGLGPTLPAQIPNQIAASAAQIAARSDFEVLLNGVAVDPSRYLYVGAAPGTAGVYQINLALPTGTPSNPEIRIGTSDRMSPAGRVLPAQ
jgi:uncharacterized protein (TIGR03437 family)